MVKNKFLMTTALMVGAQIVYAFVNFSYDVVSNPWNPMLADGKMSSSSVVFWQYSLAALFTLPLMMRAGFKHLKTEHFWLHELRAFTSACGVQVFVFGFVLGVPVWQMVGFLMTGPFWVILGSVFILGERLTPARIGATLMAFIGALFIIGIGEDGVSKAAILPVIAAILWSITTIISKYLAREETPEALTLWLMVLIVANHLVIGIGLVVLARIFPELVPHSLASRADLMWPHGQTGLWLIGLGLLTALSQYLLWSAYSRADASYLQPFDDLKLPMNTLLSWVLLSQVPSPMFWVGAALILSGSVLVYSSEKSHRFALR